jgi:LysM repeat protein
MRRLALGVALTLFVTGPALAQSASFSEESIPPSAPPSSVTRDVSAAPVSPVAAVNPPAPAPSATAGAAEAPKAPPKPRSWFAYTIRPGDSLGSIGAQFGITPEELARVNRMSPDDELLAGATLRVPNPFVAQLKSLQAQVESLNAEAQTAEQKATAAEGELRSLQDKAQELSADNQGLNASLRLLPWWRASALSAAAAAALMFGVMMVAMFEWWRMRRRYVALAQLAESLGRLDYKYKAMLAKAELRLQQLYGRRRQGLPEGQPRPKLPEEIEIERLNEELKEILEAQLVKLGARPRSAKRRARWREMISDVDTPAEAPSARR